MATIAVDWSAGKSNFGAIFSDKDADQYFSLPIDTINTALNSLPSECKITNIVLTAKIFVQNSALSVYGCNAGYGGSGSISTQLGSINSNTTMEWNGTISLNLNAAINGRQLNKNYGSYITFYIHTDAWGKKTYKVNNVKVDVTYQVPYTVSISAGANGSVDTTGGTYYPGTVFQVTATPNNGYQFSQWNDNTNNNPRKITVPSNNLTLTAYFTANTYTVKYDGNGATGGSTANSSHTYGTNKNLTLNGYTRTYTVTYNYNGNGSSNTTATATYTFKNWNTNSGGTGTSYSNQESVKNLTSTNNGTVTLYAQWNSASITLPTPTRTGYTFSGWYTASSGGTKIGNGGASYTPTANITLYAQWTPNTIKITFDRNGGSGGTSNIWYKYGISTFYSNEACTAQITAITRPTKTGHTFVHYYGNGTSGGVDGERYVAYDNIEFASDLATDIYKDATLYAEWTPNAYTVTFNANGGTVSTTSKSVTYNSTYGTLPTPTRTGHTFNGWKNDNGATVTSNSDMLIAEDHSLIAEWLPFSYTIIFNGNGDDGTGGMTSQTFKYQQDQQLTKSTFSKPNHIFTGWNTAIDGTGDDYSDEHQMKDFKPDSDGQVITLYAQWVVLTIQNIKIDNLKVVGALLDTTKIIKIFIDKVLVYNNI